MIEPDRELLLEAFDTARSWSGLMVRLATGGIVLLMNGFLISALLLSFTGYFSLKALLYILIIKF